MPFREYFKEVPQELWVKAKPVRRRPSGRFASKVRQNKCARETLQTECARKVEKSSGEKDPPPKGRTKAPSGVVSARKQILFPRMGSARMKTLLSMLARGEVRYEDVPLAKAKPVAEVVKGPDVRIH